MNRGFKEVQVSSVLVLRQIRGNRHISRSARSHVDQRLYREAGPWPGHGSSEGHIQTKRLCKLGQPFLEHHQRQLIAVGASFFISFLL